LSLFVCGDAQPLDDSDIKDLLTRDLLLYDNDSVRFYSEEEKEIAADFVAKNKSFLDSLGRKKTFYYIELADANENASMTPSFALFARLFFMKYRDDYTMEERRFLEGKLDEYRDKNYIPQVMNERGPIRELKYPPGIAE